MKTIFKVILVLTGFLSFAQKKEIAETDKIVEYIQSDATLVESEFDWVELTGITTDGGGILKIWRNGNRIVRIYEEIGFSYGRLSILIYLQNGKPIKIIECEENFESTDQGVVYDELNVVFRAEVYVFDWENDISNIKRFGKRNMSKGICSTFGYKPIIERAKKASSR